MSAHARSTLRRNIILGIPVLLAAGAGLAPAPARAAVITPFAFTTNASVNPARSTGPALFAGGVYIAQLWLFWLAPLLGAALAGVVARWQHELPD